MELCSNVRIVNKCANALIIMATDILFIFFFPRTPEEDQSEWVFHWVKAQLSPLFAAPPPAEADDLGETFHKRVSNEGWWRLPWRTCLESFHFCLQHNSVCVDWIVSMTSVRTYDVKDRSTIGGEVVRDFCSSTFAKQQVPGLASK